jgi:hypothetical protein
VLVVVLLEEVSGLGEVRKVQREHVTAAEAAGASPAATRSTPSASPP